MDQNEAALAGMMAMMGTFMLIVVLIQIFIYVCLWKIYEKAGKPGWTALVPIYNLVIMMEIINKPAIWVLYLFIPFYGIYIAIVSVVEFAKVFGKDTGFAIGLILLPIVFYPMLAFGDAQYQGTMAGEKVYDDGILDRG
ncbi:DUF5684 domain-containing protein [Bernardetia sp. Wsw4-3y2]|uniref:DUF5684 domain-containing protein n=1 Tax=unclassified Bernardetia TaxID=2647129 RepID=UPI0030CD4E6C